MQMAFNDSDKNRSYWQNRARQKRTGALFCVPISYISERSFNNSLIIKSRGGSAIRPHESKVDIINIYSTIKKTRNSGQLFDFTSHLISKLSTEAQTPKEKKETCRTLIAIIKSEKKNTVFKELIVSIIDLLARTEFDFQEEDLTNLPLSGVKMLNSNLSRGNFTGAQLQNSHLSMPTLTQTNLSNANLLNTKLGELENIIKTSHSISALSLSKDQVHIAGSFAEEITVWETSSAKAKFKLLANKKVLCLDISHKYLVAGCSESLIHIWNLETIGQSEIYSDSTQINTLVISNTDKYIACGSKERFIEIWNLFDFALLCKLYNNPQGIHSIAFSEDDARMVTGDNSTVNLWDIHLRIRRNLHVEHTDYVLSVDIFKENVVSGSKDGEVILFNTRSACTAVIGRHSTWVLCVSFAKNGAFVVSGSSKYIKIWEVESKNLIFVHKRSEIKNSFIKCRESLFASSSISGIEIWDTSNLETNKSKTYPDRVICVGVSNHGELIATGGADNLVKIWNFRLIFTLKGHTRPVNCVEFSPTSELIASASDDTTVKLWKVESGELLYNLTTHIEPVLSVAFSQNTDMLVSGGYDNILAVWDLASGNRVKSLIDMNIIINVVAISGNGEYAAAGMQTGLVQLWHVESEILAEVGGSGDICAMKFHPSGQFLIVGDQNGNLNIWNIEDLEKQRIKGHTRSVNFLQIHGQLLFSASLDLTFRAWDMRNNSCQYSLYAGLLVGQAVAVCIEKKVFVTANGGPRYFVWKHKELMNFILNNPLL